MISKENCTVNQIENGIQLVADEGFVLYRLDRYQAYLDYNQQHPDKKKSYKNFFRFTHTAYLPENNDGSAYGVMTEAEADALNDV